MDLTRAHFIGIGGVGMSAVALMLKDRGSAVTGSDEAVYEPVASFLARSGIAYRTPYAAANIPDNVTAIVIGKNAKLTRDGNAEVAAAYERGVPILSFPEVIAALAEGKSQLVVAGSYGKSTSASLIAHCLESAGRDPSYFIGALPFTPSVSGHLGAGSEFVIEGDEYPSSNEDSRSKFLHFSPAHLLVTPLSHDHLNVFPTKEDYLAPFAALVGNVSPNGSIAISVSGELSPEFRASLSRPFTTFGLSHGDWQARDIRYGDITRFTIVHEGADVVAIETRELGSHAVMNIVGVAALLLGQGLLAPEDFKKAIGTFKGIRRRLDLKSEATSVRIYEGFGSSIEKAMAAIAAMKLHFPDRRLLIAFEPHTFSWRNRGALPWYDRAFAGADKLFVYEPATQGAATHDQVTLQEIVARVKAAGIDATGVESKEAGLAAIGSELKADDIVLILTSGDMGGMVEALPTLAEEKYPA
jgi:UDP-N-acetylmuramate: L-alanyl-gamma-D-glutamyl-meso-diaminopimelate ligase